jgi:hypothetical protein
MRHYNESHLKTRNLRLELEDSGLWMLLVYIVPENGGAGIQNPVLGLMLPPNPPTNAYYAWPEHQYNYPGYQDPSQFKNHPEPTYGTAIPWQPVMPHQQNDGWAQPMIDMYQVPTTDANNYYQIPINETQQIYHDDQPPMTQMQPTYDQPPMTKMQPTYDHAKNPVVANIYSNNFQIPDDTHGIVIHQKDEEDPKLFQKSYSHSSYEFATPN